MLPWEEPQVTHPCGSAGQCFPTLIRSNRKKKKKRERDKQLILEVVVVTVCLRFYSKNQAFTDETKCIRVS